ncbi:hypothetical protein ACYOEI_32925, partial [Singulisphaera rosea]
MIRIARILMRIDKSWAERFIRACAQVPSSRRLSLASGAVIYSSDPAAKCWVVATGYVKLIDPRLDGERFTRLIQGRGGLFGDRPFGTAAFRGFASAQFEQ